MSHSNWCLLTCIQFSQETGRWSGIPISLRIFQFVVIHTVKGFSIVNEAEVDTFLEFPCFLHDPVIVVNLISGSSAFSKSSLYIWKFLFHILLKSSLKDFEYNLASVCVCVCVCVKLRQSCLTLCDTMGCSLLGTSVHKIFQARILKWIAMPFSRGSSQVRDRT